MLLNVPVAFHTVLLVSQPFIIIILNDVKAVSHVENCGGIGLEKGCEGA